MYVHLDTEYPLHLIKRVAYGANPNIRYPDDPYDRIWRKAVVGDGVTSMASDGFPSGINGGDKPPQLVLQNAITAPIINLTTGFSAVQISAYINMYFSEVSQLNSGETRSFQILMNDEPLLDSPIIPPNEIFISNFTASSTTNLSLVPTHASSLSPLINAMEVFQIGDSMTNGTDSRDVEGLTLLQEAFVGLRDWGGDPCLPSPYSWDWINCSSGNTPRVTALNLGSFDLFGEIPDFSSMDALQIVDFQNNSLVGPIPEFFATLPNLKQLNLAKNQLSGSVPDSLSKKKGLNFGMTGNPGLCSPEKSCATATRNPGVGSGGGKKKSSKVGLILGTSLPTFIIIWAIIGAFFLLRHRRKAVAVAAAVITSGTNRPHASPLNPQNMGKMGMEFMNDIKVNMEDQSNVETEDQTKDPHQNI